MKKIDWNEINRLGVLATTGDSRAYEEFLTIISNYLKFKVRNSVPDSYVEDLIQESLIAIHKSFHTFDPKKNPRAWVNAIAHYKASDFLRSYYKKELKESQLVDDTFFSKSANADDKLLIEKLIKTLGRSERQVVWMLKYEGKSIAEVGEKIGKSEANVKVICFRAIRKMRELLLREEFSG